MQIIAIDPDVKKSGVAHLDKQNKTINSQTLPFPQLIEYLTKAKQTHNTQLTIIVEAGWLNAKSNFHGGYGAVGQRIAKNVGANHQVGKNIIEWCQYIGLNVIPKRPLRKIWKGTNKKITAQELNQLLQQQNLPQLPKRTNQDQRDAILLAIQYAD